MTNLSLHQLVYRFRASAWHVPKVESIAAPFHDGLSCVVAVELKQHAIGWTRQRFVHHLPEIRDIPFTAFDTTQNGFAGEHHLAFAIGTRLFELLTLRLGSRLAGHLQFLGFVRQGMRSFGCGRN
ncbi:hypothetical protein WI88_16210 [Burkholderia ubonensis]|nr:hypothetical protein WI88_16210 [Burkholderia ubonensis]